MNWEEYFQQQNNPVIALYGLGTETERFLNEYGQKLTIAGLLDGFRDAGELYGYPIIPLNSVVSKGVTQIIVVARPGSCKAIEKRIGDFCREQEIGLLDVRGKDLLLKNKITYQFGSLAAGTRAELMQKIDRADTVSFDLFDTLVMRRIASYTDVFELLEARLSEKGIEIPGFAALRLAVEKELSRNRAPKLEEIYEELLRRAEYKNPFVTNLSVGKKSECDVAAKNKLESDLPVQILSETELSALARELSALEWELDSSLMIKRQPVCEIFKMAVSMGKSVFITTDTYYHREDLEELLQNFGLEGGFTLLISSECGTAKTDRLFELLSKNAASDRILHVGDDVYADMEQASKRGFDTFRIYSGEALYEALGGLGAEQYITTLSDKVKKGLLIAKLFADPFQFEKNNGRITIFDSYEIGYLCCAPMITDFIIWLQNRIRHERIDQILFCARDGYLMDKLYRRIDSETNAIYFLTSRIAAIRAGMENEEDIAYVDSMQYSGTAEEKLKVRFGIELTTREQTIEEQTTGEQALIESANKEYLNMEERRNQDIIRGYHDAILEKAAKQRENYRCYIEQFSLKEGTLAMFDFVAKGTTQLYLQRLFSQHLKGFYFLRLEPEFMKNRGLAIEAFYTDSEKEDSAVFDNYYILETILTSPDPTTVEFDEAGQPVYAKELRSKQELACVEQAQKGIEDYFEAYTNILPRKLWKENKQLDEVLLMLLKHIEMDDTSFSKMQVEDIFFGRNTEIQLLME